MLANGTLIRRQSAFKREWSQHRSLEFFWTYLNPLRRLHDGHRFALRAEFLVLANAHDYALIRTRNLETPLRVVTARWADWRMGRVRNGE